MTKSLFLLSTLLKVSIGHCPVTVNFTKTIQLYRNNKRGLVEVCANVLYGA